MHVRTRDYTVGEENQFIFYTERTTKILVVFL
jgi:hypothetical protein